MELLTYASLGLTAGGAYALVALGLVASYRGTGVINFGQGALGMFGAYAFWKLFDGSGVPLAPAIVIGLGASIAVGLGFYALVGKRLATAPATTKILITLGLMLVIQAVVRLLWTNHQQVVDPFLVAGGFDLAGVRVQRISLLLATSALAATALLHVLFTRTRFGHITTAIQDTDLGAQAIGINPRFWGSLAWGLSGGLAALAGILVLPVTQLSPLSLTTLLVPALGAALAARFSSFWIALAVGLGAGVGEGLLTGLADAQIARAFPHVVTLGAVLLLGRAQLGRGTREVQTQFHVGDGRLRPGWFAVIAGVLVVLVFAAPSTIVDSLSITAIVAIVALGIVVATGYAGQVSILPLTIAGLSMLVFAALSHHGASLPAAFLVTISASVVIALVISPAFIRSRSYEITIGSLAIAAIVQSSVFSIDAFFNGTTGWRIGDTSLGPVSLSNMLAPKSFAIAAWTVLALSLVAVAVFRRSRFGRQVLSVRQDERIPAALGIHAARAKLLALLLSSALWSTAGVLFAIQRAYVSKGQGTLEGFSYLDSLALVALVILAGAGYLVGAVLAGVFFPGGLLSSLLSFSPGVNDWLSLFFAANTILMLTLEPDGVVGQAIRVRRARRTRRQETEASGVSAETEPPGGVPVGSASAHGTASAVGERSSS